MITWRPIAELPDELKDGRRVLIGEHETATVGCWGYDNFHEGWSDELTSEWAQFEPTHFAEINAPEGES